MDFQIVALPAGHFSHLYGLSDADLARQGVTVYEADARPGFPCRVSLCDAAIGDRVLLFNYTHQPAASAYRASHAIFVRDGAETASPATSEVPEVLRIRPLSVRAFDAAGIMHGAELVDGRELEPCIERLFADSGVDYLQVHNAARGCYAARVDRVPG